jgi:hypothetical protein
MHDDFAATQAGPLWSQKVLRKMFRAKTKFIMSIKQNLLIHTDVPKITRGMH